MSLYVVVPNWNGADMLEVCFRSLTSQGTKCTVVMVDNGSDDDSVTLVENKFPNVVVLKNPKNLGFTGGVNPGINYALENGATAVALFNNDAVADENWLKYLDSALKNEKQAGIVTCKLLRSDKKHFDSTGDFYSTRGIPFPRGRNQIDKQQFDSEKYVFAASGGASIYRASMLREIGLFDDKYFAYYEDVDISFRAQLAGWKVLYEPRAVAYHDLSQTSSKMGDFTRYHSIKNFLILYSKCMPTRLYFKYLPLFLYQFCRTTMRAIVDKKIGVWARAVRAFLSLIPSIIKDRRKINALRRTSDAEIDKLLYKQRPPKIPTLGS